MTFKTGQIFYFTPFYFKNGAKSKNKYFLVLHVEKESIVLASLPTSKNYVPKSHSNHTGCIELPQSNFNCYLIPQNEPITSCGKAFPKETYLYGHLLDEYDKHLLSEVYPKEHKDYAYWGEIKTEILREVLKCFKESSAIKRKYKTLIAKAF